MGIFSLFGKKDRPAETPAPDKEAKRSKRDGDASRVGTPRPASTRNSQMVQRDAARATAKKIDAIESEMTSELSRTPSKSVKPAPTPPPRPTAPAVPASKENGEKASPPTLPTMGMTTDFLLGSNTTGVVEISSSETPAIIEEAAILFANEQNDVVEQMLRGALHDTTLGDAQRTVWMMLFDLYQITGKQQEFEHLSIEFAAKFETSPPAWDTGRLDSQTQNPQPSGAVPALTFSGKLDESIVKQLDRAQKLSEKSSVLRLEFSRVTEVLPAGCELLLAALKKLQKAGYELILVGAPDFAAKIRATLEVGRRDESEAPWLLLLEILQLLNREAEFEEASIDYCVTYEVSPPPFIAPKKVSTAVEETIAIELESEAFTMPAVLDGRNNILAGIAEYVQSHDSALLDCARLTRVDFSAAGQLLSTLAPLAATGKTIELQNVNYLVAALFHVMGLLEIARVQPRKH